MSDDIFNFLDDKPEWVPEPWMETKNFVLVTEANLVECIDSCINAPKGVYSLDLECTGLDNRVFNGETVSKIVGVCLSGDGETGWYIPLRHRDEGADYNVPWMTFDREFRRLMAATVEGKVRAVFHNGKFDQEFLEFNGGEPYGDWDGYSKWEDTLILAYLRNSRARRKGLKALSEAPHECSDEDRSPVGGPGLGMKMLELDDVFKLVFGEDKAKGMDKDFSRLDPSNPIVLAYACSDAICTYLLYFLLLPAVVGSRAKPDQKRVYNIEKSAVGGTRWMERNRIPVSKAKVLELITLGQREWFDSVMEVYEAAAEVLGRDVMPGYFKVLRDNFVHDDPLNLLSHQIERAKSLEERLYPNPLGKQRGLDSDGKEKDFPLIYDVTAPQQLGVMFDEMQVPGLKRTENSGQVKTSKDELQRVVEEASGRFPFMGKIQRFREVNKALATYLYPILLGMDPSDSTIRINFNGHQVDTGRFATPSKDKEGLASVSHTAMVGWPALNFQAIPSTYDPRRPACMNRIRECIVARDGFYIVTIDFSGEELRLITNLYREPKWENEFFRCSGCGRTFPKGDGTKTPEPPPARCPNCGSDKIGDLHTLTALEIYGQDAPNKPEWKRLRGNAKGTNFGLSYGGGGQAVCRATGCDKQEGWRIKHQFDATYSGLAAGWERQHDTAKRLGYVTTAWGRKYPLPDIKHEDGGFRSKAERNSVNGPIQGCLHGDSRVPTSLGVRRIEDLTGQTFNVWTGTHWVEGRAFPSGPKPLVHTTLTSGLVMRTSPDHRFRVFEDDRLGWVRQEDLTPDLWVATDAKGIDLPEQSLVHTDDGDAAHNKKGYEYQGNDPALWELLGLVIGDGSIRKDGLIIHVGGPDAEAQANFYADRFAGPLGLKPVVKERPRPKGDDRLPMWQVRIWNQAFRDFCRGLGVEDWNTYTKRVPEAVWSQPSKYRAAFLRGYFSADGCVNVAEAVDVRSVNSDLLMDTHKLLRTLGIRSTVRLRSKRVSIKDRWAFRKKVGFLVPEKSDRLAAIKTNPWTGQWHVLPPTLIQRIGDVVYRSSIYGDLSCPEKSAVLRLKLGSGSKPQCLRYLAKLPPGEVPSEITALLEYDYEQVVGVEVMGEAVEMFDIEVFDDEHAFVCDGVVVHNSGADMIKIAMALVYKEVKKRGWLGKVNMIATMHDELVFEIHGPVLEEAITILKKTMGSNGMIMQQRWPVPFTSDVELGHDFTVKWDLNEMIYGEVRFTPEGKKLKKPEQAEALGLVWDDLSSWPAELTPFFKAAQGGPTTPEGGGGGEDEGEDTPEQPPAQEEPSAAPQQQVEAVPDTSRGARQERQQVAPRLEQGQDYDFLVPGLTPMTALKLAEVIEKCRGNGNHRLRLKGPDGRMLEGWDQHEAILVDGIEFYYAARNAGLA